MDSVILINPEAFERCYAEFINYIIHITLMLVKRWNLVSSSSILITNHNNPVAGRVRICLKSVTIFTNKSSQQNQGDENLR